MMRIATFGHGVGSAVYFLIKITCPSVFDSSLHWLHELMSQGS